MGDDNVVLGVPFGRRRARDTDASPAGHDAAIKLLVEGTATLADALATLAADTPDDIRAQALRARCDVLTRLIQDQVKALAARRDASIGGTLGKAGPPEDQAP